MSDRTENFIFIAFTLIVMLAYARTVIQYPGTIEYLGLFSESKKKRKDTRKGAYFLVSLLLVWIVGFVVWISLPNQLDCVTQYTKDSYANAWKVCK